MIISTFLHDASWRGLTANGRLVSRNLHYERIAMERLAVCQRFFWREGIYAACIMSLKRISIFGYRRHSLTRAADSVAAIKVVTSFRCHNFIGTVYVLGVIVSAFSCKWNASASTFHFEVKERPVENFLKCDTVGRIYSKIFFAFVSFIHPWCDRGSTWRNDVRYCMHKEQHFQRASLLILVRHLYAKIIVKMHQSLLLVPHSFSKSFHEYKISCSHFRVIAVSIEA